MKKKLVYVTVLLFLVSCKTEVKNTIDTTVSQPDTSTTVRYANGFKIDIFGDYKVVTVTKAWQDSDKHFKYALTEDKKNLPDSAAFDAVIILPIKKIVVTSTTHIPSLEMLGVDSTLIGFPNLNYISSNKTRKRIKKGTIRELGKNEDLNTEILIDLQPDVVVSFGVSGKNKTLDIIKNTGIPVVYNADWLETSPLGKAEWIKFFGALYDKEKEADSIFNMIENRYNKAKELALKSTNSPSVLSGSLYKDVWYAPAGKSWAAQFINDANGNYIWKKSNGTGSIQLSIESVLDKAQNAEFWIGPGYAKNLQQMKEAHPVYTQFEAYKNKKVFGFTNKTGETGGVLYFELGPNRPDLILKDLIKILHPELLPHYNLTFFNTFE